MFKKKKIDLFDEHSPTVSTGGGRGGLSHFLTQLMLAVLLITGLTAVAGYFLQQQQAGLAQQQSAGSTAQMLAERITDFSRTYQDIASRHMQQQDLATLFQSQDWQGLQEQALALQRLLPEGSNVRLFPYDWDQTDEKASPPVSFASLDLLRRVEKSGSPSNLEVHQFNSPQQHLALVVPVGPAGNISGTALIALPFKLLPQMLNGVGESGRFQLQQVVDGKSLALVSTSTLNDNEIIGNIPVSHTLWQLAYAGGGADQTEALLQNLGLILVAGLLMLLIIYALYQNLRKRFEDDQATLLTLVEGVSQGRSAGAPHALTAEMQGAFNLVAQLGQAVGRKLKNAAPTQDKGQSEMEVEEGHLSDEDMLDLVRANPSREPSEISDRIFCAYDIRGVVGDTLTEEVVLELGRAIGSEAHDRGQQTVIVARDGRNSSESLCDALCRGLMASGRDVVDIGQVPTPLLYFATHFLGSKSGVVVTGSHNPVDYNGLKIVIAGEALSGDAILGLRDRLRDGNLLEGNGGYSEQDLVDDYIKRVADDVQLTRPLKVVIDCGSGVAGLVAPDLLRAIGCEVIELYTEIDGNFPHHHPDPGQPENLADLIAIVNQQGADLGLAFDGDGDRLGVVDSNGKVIWPDRLLMLLARDVLLRQPGGDVIFDVKSTRHLASEILAYGGRPIMWKSGHSLMKAKMRETGALLAGEMSGHIFFKERWYGFDDALYAAARLLEVLSAEVVRSAEVFAEFPEGVSTHELVMPLTQGDAHELMTRFAAEAEFTDAKIINIDGIRAEFRDGWGLIRASNTTPSLVFRFEADSAVALDRIEALFKEQLGAVAPDETPPF